ncbi:MAG: hypothetical protein NC485_00945 [Ruminococcus flavefaciens]|nr:hypothetical protein [Ruminococcus flavefaciens]
MMVVYPRRKYYGVTSGALHRCNCCSAALDCRFPYRCKPICPSGLAIAIPHQRS